MNEEVEKFLNSLISLDEDKTMSIIFEQVDNWFCTNKFDAVDDILLCDPSSKPVEFSIALLSVTLCVKNKLKNRSLFFDKTKVFLDNTRPSETYDLLKGLE